MVDWYLINEMCSVHLLYCLFAVCAVRQRKSRLKAAEFIAGNVEHMQSLARMGIHLVTMTDGRVQLLHMSSQVSLIVHFICYYVRILV